MLKKSSNGKLLPKGCIISLACSVGSISIACGSLLQLQSTTERISIPRGFCLTSLGFLYFISLTDFFNKYLLETQQGINLRKKYHLMVSDVMDITNKIVSAIQAAFSFLAGLVVCKSTCSKSFLFASHYVLEAYAWFGTAYFMYDIWSMYKVHLAKISDKFNPMKQILKSPQQVNLATHSENGSCTKTVNHLQANVPVNELYEYNKLCRFNGTKCAQTIDFLKYMFNHPVMMIHHIFIGTFGFLVIVYIRGAGDCIYSFMFMMEFSTPFVSLRGILSILGLKNNKIYVVNGMTMLITFFMCRILMWPYVFYWYSIIIDKPFFQSIVDLSNGCKIGILILLLPQIYWFILMLKGALKVLFPMQTDEQFAEKLAEKFQKNSKNNNLSPSVQDNPIYNLILAKKSATNQNIIDPLIKDKNHDMNG